MDLGPHPRDVHLAIAASKGKCLDLPIGYMKCPQDQGTTGRVGEAALLVNGRPASKVQHERSLLQ